MAFLYIVLSWVVFYSLHSLLASYNLKIKLKAKWPVLRKKYRLIYSLLSSILFLGIVIQALFLPYLPVFNPSKFSAYLGYMLTTLGVVICLRSLKEISFANFLGFTDTTSKSEDPLVIRGIYSKIRHPLYLGLLFIFFGFFVVSGTLGAFIHLFCLLVYLPIGIYFEEKNLLKMYGSAYDDYRKRIPAILPFKLKKGL